MHHESDTQAQILEKFAGIEQNYTCHICLDGAPTSLGGGRMGLFFTLQR